MALNWIFFSSGFVTVEANHLISLHFCPFLNCFYLFCKSTVKLINFCFASARVVCSVYVYLFTWVYCNNVDHHAIIHPSVERLEA